MEDQVYSNPIFIDSIQKNYIYDEKTYIRTWLQKVQGTCFNEVPRFVIEIIKKDIKENRIEKINYKVIRKILKENKLSKYYDDINNIIYLTTGRRFFISDIIENDIINMFKKYHEPFLLYKNKNRKNKSYPYIIHKFFLIMGYTEYLDFFPLLQSRSKLIEQEELFEKICKYNGWKFIPSI